MSVDRKPPSPRPSVVAPGNHDGVHLGHRALLATARARADERGLATVALFFDPHPTRLLAPERAPTLLTTPTRRAELLRRAGADEVLVLPFDEAFASTAPRVFAEDILRARCDARAVVVGPDFHFGAKRAGNVDTLRELGVELGYDVLVVPPVTYGDGVSSSTRIRRVLKEGGVEEAARLLCRFHEVDGLVVTGHQRGRTIGFPTANLDCEAIQLPMDGVYAVVGRRLDVPDAPLLRGVANLGVRPTMAAGRSVEVHFLDFSGDLYGARMRVAFTHRLRPEQKFSGIDELKAQIARDAAEARARLEAVYRDAEQREWLSWL